MCFMLCLFTFVLRLCFRSPMETGVGMAATATASVALVATDMAPRSLAGTVAGVTTAGATTWVVVEHPKEIEEGSRKWRQHRSF